jgi:ABC-2 type transport system permease protein
VFKDGVRVALGLGRGPRAKVLPWFFIGVLVLMALVMAMIAGAAERLGGPGAAEQMNLPSHADFYGIASIILYVFAAIAAPELLTRDRHEGVINLYLVRPLSATNYLAARWLAFLSVMAVVAWVPQAVLFTGLSMGDPSPADYLIRHWVDIPRFLAAGLVMATFLTTLAMLTASFTRRRAMAAIFLVGLFVVSAPFTVGLARELEGATAQWVSMFNLTSIPVHVNDLIFDDVSEITDEAPAGQLGSTVHALWYLAWTAIPALVLRARYRRLTA